MELAYWWGNQRSFAIRRAVGLVKRQGGEKAGLWDEKLPGSERYTSDLRLGLPSPVGSITFSYRGLFDLGSVSLNGWHVSCRVLNNMRIRGCTILQSVLYQKAQTDIILPVAIGARYVFLKNAIGAQQFNWTAFLETPLPFRTTFFGLKNPNRDRRRIKTCLDALKLGRGGKPSKK